MREVWGALVALTAVFLLHGVQCAGHDSSSRTDEGATTALSSLAPAASGLHHSPSEVGAHASPVASDRIGPGSAETQQPHPSPGELAAVCLAVLSAGLALLVALLLRPGTVTGQSRSWAWAQRWASAPALLRPPDLFTLCVLRN